MSSVKPALETCFNPRAREGRDILSVNMPRCLPSFNPRAREGRDKLAGVLMKDTDLFQSTRPRGTRPCVLRPFILKVLFQSTRPRGTRPARLRYEFQDPDRFNPRAREGRDEAAPDERRAQKVSIHAPARDATPRLCYEFQDPDSFNPRAREGRDSFSLPHDNPRRSFNPRAREGRDLS